MIDKDEFENLNAEEQAKIFHESEISEKWDLLRHAEDPEKLAQSLSREEFYLVTREMDQVERSEIIKFAHFNQLTFVADMECWEKDRLQKGNFLNWLETLQVADERRLFVWLCEADFELIVSGFQHLITVLKPDWEWAADEKLGDRPFFTLDERYYISADEENLSVIRRSFELLFEHHRGRYAAILEGIMAEPEDVAEEEAYIGREKRLADRGFPSREAAREIYRPLVEGEFEKFPLKTNEAPSMKEASFDGLKLPNYVALWTREALFLDQVLQMFRESETSLEGIYEEIAWISNKVIASEGIDFSSQEKVSRGVERARCTLSLGLEILSKGDAERAKQILTQRWLEIIFRVGVTELTRMRELIRPFVRDPWEGNFDLLIQFLGAPYDGIIEGAYRIFPEHFDLTQKDFSDPFRPFKSLEEFLRTRRAVEQIAELHRGILKQNKDVLKTVMQESDNPLMELSMTSMLGTFFASFFTAKTPSARALSQKACHTFLKKAFIESGARRTLSQQSKQRFLEALYDEPTRDLMRPLWGTVFQELDDELGALPLDESLDIRFVKTLWVREA